MDTRTFDAIAREIAGRKTKRGALRVILGALVGIGVGLPEEPASARACRVVGAPCGKRKKARCCRGAVCRKGVVGGNVCTCPPPLTGCRGRCVDTATDPLACGATCAVCPDDTDCCNGLCCKAGQRCCGGRCIDLTSDNLNCGGCTQECPGSLTCCDSRCRDLRGDQRHCGGCYQPCPNGEECFDGQCACRAPRADCGDGVCRNLQSDSAHCGACGMRCSPNQLCRAGQCACRPGFRRCANASPEFCGLPDDAICQRDSECCNPAQGSCRVLGGVGRCVPCQGVRCGGPGYDFQCCGGLTCEEAPPPNSGRYCGGCAGRDWYCTNDSDCCSSDCTGGDPNPEVGKTCLSTVGGRCVSNEDCRTCRRGPTCTNACVGGRCRV